MKNRDYVDGFVRIIEGEFAKAESKDGFVGRAFLESPELLEVVKKSSYALFDLYNYPEISNEKFDKYFAIAVNEVMHLKQRGMAPSIGIDSEVDSERKWLDQERMTSIGWESEELRTYRDRYIAYLSSIGRNQNYIEETKRSSLEITRKLGDPLADHSFYVRGLVVGSVQSGKTANFNAVINSAIDVGYGLIIVLSGIMEDLRKQTQERIEKEVEGKFEEGKFIGVGEISSFGDSAYALHNDVKSIIVPTSRETDFRRSVKEADFSLNNRNILVCKKNTGVLKNLLLWLDRYLNDNKDKILVPLLIIDDEADNASLNNLGEKGAEYASIINGHIRALLGLFEKKTYLGYTATPFGNILQDRHESPGSQWKIVDREEEYSFPQTASLFPSDFIELLFPPPNYIGAKHFFDTVSDDVSKIDPLIAPPVSDHINSYPRRLDKETELPTTNTGRGTRAARKDDDFPKQLPKSLEDAVMCFIISTAIRASRKSIMYESKLYEPHNTMLIHISRFITWQSKTKILIHKFCIDLEERLQNDNPQDRTLIYGDFENIWNKYYANIVSNIWTYLPAEYEDEFLVPKTFLEIKPLLISVVQQIEVKAINSDPPKDSLDYPDNSEKVYIAIGGNRLSRGFTLSGLTVNYFVRNTDFADTLLQMGRWFGYRPGYLDCCKLFTTLDSIEKFNQTTLTIEDLEQKFIDMNRDPSNTPEKYALKVLTHPGVLKITRASILKNTKELKFSFSDQLVQTRKFYLEQERISNAWNAFSLHLKELSEKFAPIKNSKGEVEYFSFETENIGQLFEFLDLPHSYCDDDIDEVKRYIESCNEKNKLRNWTIALKATGRGKELSLLSSGIDDVVQLSLRRGPHSDQLDLLQDLKEKSIFHAGGKSANIVSGGRDLRLRLSSEEIAEAEFDFKELRLEDLIKKYPDSSESDLREAVERTTVPEKVYRQKMSDKEGVLLIYLLDLEEVFKSTKDGSEVSGVDEIRNSLDLSIPLIGYAIGVPPVEGDIGGNYLQSKFHIEREFEDDSYEDMEDEIDGS